MRNVALVIASFLGGMALPWAARAFVTFQVWPVSVPNQEYLRLAMLITGLLAALGTLVWIASDLEAERRRRLP